MKKIILTLITLIVPLLAISQDVIVKMDGNEILAKVLEINDEEIKYKIFSNQDGPLHVIKKSDVLEIKYPNGTTEIINEEQEGSNKNNNKHDSKIVRVGSSYYQNSRPLSYPAVTKILGESNNIEISENWRKGNSQKATSTPLIAVGVPLVAGAITSGILLGYDILDFELEGNPLFYLCVIGGSAGIFLTSYGIHCKTHGKKLANKAIDDYNNSATSLNLKNNVKVSFGLSHSSLGAGLFLTF